VKIETALLIDDDDAFRATLQGSLRRRGVSARTAATVQEGICELADRSADRVVGVHPLPHEDGLSALPRLRRASPDAVIIMLTGYGDIPLAVAAVKEGADTLLGKPVDPEHLLRVAGELLAQPDRRYTQSRGALAWDLGELEREAVRAAIKHSGGNVANAARLLGIDRRTLQRKLKRLY
jgi:two-component system response regulator RegA